MSSRFPVLRLLLLLLLTAGCDRSPTPPEQFDPHGTLSFTYRGAISGSYQATGELPLQTGGLPTSGTGARAVQQEGVLALVAFRGAAAQGDLFSLVLGEVRGPGTLTLDPLACQQQNLAGCRLGVLSLEVDPSQLDAGGDLAAQLAQLAERTYLLLLGSVTITSLTEKRVRGTFQATGLRGGEPGVQNLITITDGAFDLPMQPR
ncbi:MAG: hypothetical protein H0W11_10765 [Gemmatimonadetes bacterium]|nr:hypothetical protein [Gemmatimonadota bacterium]